MINKRYYREFDMEMAKHRRLWSGSPYEKLAEAA